MYSPATTVSEYIASLPENRRKAITDLRKMIRKYLPEGFKETMSYGMIAYVVPHKLYPSGYHADSSQPLPFLSIASQKNFIALYHMGLQADKTLKWFTSEYAKRSKTKLDMGKSCIRLRKPEDVPLDLIGDLVSKMSVDEWIALYESRIKKK